MSNGRQAAHSGALTKKQTALIHVARKQRGMSDGPIATVKACVAEHYGVTVNALVSARKERHVTGPRHIAMWLCRELTPFSPAQIGRQFGNRDRKTVVNAWERAEARMAADPILKTEVEALADAIAAPGGVPAVSGSPVRDTALALRNEAQALRERAARLNTLADNLLESA